MIKRLIDIFVATIGLVVTLPVIATAAAAVRLMDGKPVFFRQLRPGYRGRPFWLVKLRTMGEGQQPDGTMLPDSERMTVLGRFLRRTSIDELPQLWNVLRGDMSLVGPRPLLMQYLSRYSPEQARRHDVRPGITGWAQVNGRNAVEWEEKFALDVWYVDHQSLWLDLKILLLTVRCVLVRRGINQTGHVTTEEFHGTGA